MLNSLQKRYIHRGNSIFLTVEMVCITMHIVISDVSFFRVGPIDEATRQLINYSFMVVSVPITVWTFYMCTTTRRLLYEKSCSKKRVALPSLLPSNMKSISISILGKLWARVHLPAFSLD